MLVWRDGSFLEGITWNDVKRQTRGTTGDWGGNAGEKPQFREKRLEPVGFHLSRVVQGILKGAVILMRGSSKRSNKKGDGTGQILIMSKKSPGPHYFYASSVRHISTVWNGQG
ncbi:hypothetical protein RUM44_005898 [Polyplax serrata]|uniref:Uncharacterized protein n=1 Tax=Polyplax serrata TaxID=468196 RepID=A0ABR1AYD3_POLSC